MTPDGKFQDPMMEEQFQEFVKFLQEEEDEEMANMEETEARELFILARTQADDFSDEGGNPFEDDEKEVENDEGTRLVAAKKSVQDLVTSSGSQLAVETPARLSISPQEEVLKSDAVYENVARGADPELDKLPTLARGREPPKKEFGEIIDDLKEEWGEDGKELAQLYSDADFVLDVRTMNWGFTYFPTD